MHESRPPVNAVRNSMPDFSRMPPEDLAPAIDALLAQSPSAMELAVAARALRDRRDGARPKASLRVPDGATAAALDDVLCCAGAAAGIDLGCDVGDIMQPPTEPQSVLNADLVLVQDDGGRTADDIALRAGTLVDLHREIAGTHLIIGIFVSPDEGDPASVAVTNRALRHAVTGKAGVSLLDCTWAAGPLDTGSRQPGTAGEDARMLSTAAAIAIARPIVQIFAAMRAPPKKLIVCDLDNTLWGGQIGEDGAENLRIANGGPNSSYWQLQAMLKDLAASGMLLAILSRNTLEDIQAAFEARSEMPLALDDFAHVEASFAPKADGMAQLLDRLAVAPEHALYLDDDPIQRHAVRAAFPAIETPDEGGDPDALCNRLSLLLATTVSSHTEEDAIRTQSLRTARAVRDSIESAPDRAAMLAKLEMTLTPSPLDATGLRRLAQLSERVTQFTPGVLPVTVESLSEKAADNDYHLELFALRDIYADYGRIAGCIVRADGDNARIEGFFLSCRVFGRGIETALLASIEDWARGRGCRTLTVEARRTDRNGPFHTFLEEGAFVAEPAADGVIARKTLSDSTTTSPPYLTVDERVTAAP